MGGGGLLITRHGYLVCDLQEFVGGNLHYRIGAKRFRLHVHRTEVVRFPSRYDGSVMDEPIFPLRAKYFHSNFRVEGLEARRVVEKHDRPDNSGDPLLPDYEKMIPQITPEEWNLPSTLVTDKEIRFKFAIDGRRLNVDETGTAIRRTANWRPEEIPFWHWKRCSETEKAIYRASFLDARKMPVVDYEG